MGFRGGRMGGDMRMVAGRYGMGGMPGRGPVDEYQGGYSSMSPYGRGFSGGYPAGYGPTPSPYGIQPGYSTGGYGAYTQGYAGYAPSAGQQQMTPGYSNPQGYGSRGGLHDGDSSPTLSQGSSAGYAMSQGTQSAIGGGIGASGYDTYGRSQQQQYPYHSSTVSGYGGVYGLYGGAASGSNVRTMSAQDGYEGAYGAHRQGVSQSRLDRSQKPY